MRIPFPERIPYFHATVFAALLAVVQLLQHTDLIFVACSFAFALVAVAAFNLAGGMYRPAGAYVMFNALLTVEIGIIIKAFFGEAGQKNLVNADHAMELYVLGMLGIFVAAYIENRFRVRRPLLPTLFPAPDLGVAYRGAAAIGAAVTLYFMFPIAVASGTVLSLLRNTNEFLPFSIILGVIYVVRSSGGKRSTNPWIIAIIVLTTCEGLLSFSKQAIFTPEFCWVVGAAISGYKLRPVNYIVIGVALFLSFNIATPYSQYGRNLKATGTGNGALANAPIAIALLSHPLQMRENYEEDAANAYGTLNYYDRSAGIFDRLQLIAIDSALINVTDQKGTFGYWPIAEGFENLIPHFLWPNKPTPYYGNTFAHELGGLDDQDLTTGVSFSITADAYHEGALVGVMAGIPIVMCIIFMTWSFLIGDLRDHPAGLILTLVLSHVASEGGFWGLPALIEMAFIALAFGFVCKYIFPLAGSIFEPQRLADNVLNPSFAPQ